MSSLALCSSSGFDTLVLVTHEVRFDTTGWAEGQALEQCRILTVSQAPGTLVAATQDVPAETAEVTSKTHRTEYMRFTRCCQNPKRMPKELLERYSGGPISRNDLFQEWLEMGQDMEAVKLSHLRRLEVKHRTRTVYGWRTRSDLLKLYNDADFVDDLVRRKTREGLWAPHPEAPGNHKMLLYYVRLDTTLTVDESMSDQMNIKAEGALDKAGLEKLTKGGIMDRSAFPKIPGLYGKALDNGKALGFGFDPMQTELMNKRTVEEEAKSEDKKAAERKGHPRRGQKAGGGGQEAEARGALDVASASKL